MSQPSEKSPFADFEELLALLPLGSEQAVDEVRARDAQLTKPAGSLGELEKMVEHLARWQESGQPTLNNPMVAIFAGNHGVTKQGVSAFPPEVTIQMVANFTNGGAAISQMCALHELNLRVFELALELPTGDFTQEAAMDDKTCAATVAYGMEAIAGKPDLLCIGEMGIGNTTVAAAIMSAIMNLPASKTVGKGTGVTDEVVQRKQQVVTQALSLHAQQLADPYDLLASIGGFEIVQITGAMLAAAEQKIAVVVDGFICTAAALVAIKINPNIKEYLIFAHCSGEQGHQKMLAYLDVKPLLNLGLRLGEGTGAALSLPLLQAAVGFYNEMASFSQAAVTNVVDNERRVN